MYWYIIIAVVIVLFLVFLYLNFPSDEDDEDDVESAENFSSPEAEKKIDKLVKKDINKARKIVKDDLKIFDALQREHNSAN